LEEQTVAQLVKKCSSFCEIRHFFAVLIAHFHWLLFWLEQIYFHIVLLHFIKINSNIILPCASVPWLDFLPIFTAPFYVFTASPMLTPSPANLLDWLIVIIFGDEHKL
jgi:hypothetical protein